MKIKIITVMIIVNLSIFCCYSGSTNPSGVTYKEHVEKTIYIPPIS